MINTTLPTRPTVGRTCRALNLDFFALESRARCFFHTFFCRHYIKDAVSNNVFHSSFTIFH